MALYFAYGSNVCVPHFRAHLAGCGIDPAEARNPRRAILTGYDFRTNYHSVVHRAGAANIDAAAGRRVEGVLFEVSPGVRQALRRKEGWPVRYREIEVAVEVANSDGVVSAFSFAVTPQHRLATDQPVTPHYRRLILAGATEFGFSESYRQYLRQVLRPVPEGAAIPQCDRSAPAAPTVQSTSPPGGMPTNESARVVAKQRPK